MNDYRLPNLKEAARRQRDPEHIARDLFTMPEEYRTLGEGKRYYILTHGCQANERDSETMAGMLEGMGYQKASSYAESDLILVNTCAVRQNAEEKVYGELGAFLEYKRKKPEMLIGMCGCMAQEERSVQDVLKKYPQVDLIFGTHNLHRLPALLAETMKTGKKVVEIYSREGEVVEDLPSHRNSRHKAWVNIMYGCDKFCTYCIVPYTRGKERSRRIGDILAELKELKAQNYREICLLGQNVNAYGLDLGHAHGFAQLLQAASEVGFERIRFMTPHPHNFDQECIDVLAAHENLMPYIHLPVQSGSDRILKKMNRSYSREEYLDLFDRIREKIPQASFSTDIIVGFPNETDEDFADTLSLYDHCQFDSAFTFIYSPRGGTPAARMEDLTPREVKEERLQILNEKVGYYAHERNAAFLNREVIVLCDGSSKKKKEIFAGYTPENKLVNFKGENIHAGDLVKVRITETHSYSLNGEAVEIISPFPYNISE
ncbi:MAG: tRNA (N6-isopentenyl adenosine(37)-C2)-methylthiotransferase MiaB [Erysipelotrichaceae bacterium]|nr:tRNA (N6-isopentenyl adenosine(37)-C2)-methylthiotransferase MiaB [Erysipelotrichaceae bacterium]